MKYKAILFDLDGTIIQTEEIWDQASVKLMNKNPNACPIVKKELASKLIGRALHESCQLIKDTLELPESVEELIYEKESHALKLYETNLFFLDGFHDFYNESKKLNLKSAVATNSTLRALDVVKNSMNLEQFFGEHIYSMEHVNKKAKPHPDIFLYAADKLEMNPKDCLVIEDSLTGVSAAKAAGMFCIQILSPGVTVKESPADIVVDAYQAINLQRILQK